MTQQQPASIHDVVLGLQLERAVNIIALNWPVLTPQQKARITAAIPKQEWPEREYKEEQNHHAKHKDNRL